MNKFITAMLLSMFALTSFASGKVEECKNFGKFAAFVVTVRDKGVDRLQLKDDVRVGIEEKTLTIFNMQQFYELSRIIDILYGHPEVTAEYAEQSYFQFCMESERM